MVNIAPAVRPRAPSHRRSRSGGAASGRRHRTPWANAEWRDRPCSAPPSTSAGTRCTPHWRPDHAGLPVGRHHLGQPVANLLAKRRQVILCVENSHRPELHAERPDVVMAASAAAARSRNAVFAMIRTSFRRARLRKMCGSKSQVNSTPPCNRHAIRGDEHTGFGHFGFCQRSPDVGVELVGRGALHGVPDHLVLRDRQLRRQVGGAMLQGLEARDRLAELLACLHVFDGAFGDRARAAGAVGGNGKRHGPRQRRVDGRRIRQDKKLWVCVGAG